MTAWMRMSPPALKPRAVIPKFLPRAMFLLSLHNREKAPPYSS